MKPIILLIVLSILSSSCNSQEKNTISPPSADSMETKIAVPIGQYVVKVFKDSKGNLWFGTIEKGVAKYDGKQLKYYSTYDGLPSKRVTGIIEDSDGNLWFGTGAGLSKFDGENFTNFTKEDGLCSNMISNLFIDSKNKMWIGTWGGVCTYDGDEFNDFPIPYPEVNTRINEDTKDWITEIKEDADGNIWIGRDVYGACRYDLPIGLVGGNSFTHYLKKGGLHSNNVTEIEMDKSGNIWLGTRVAEKDNPDPRKRTGKGGINKLVQGKIISFPDIEGFNDGDVYEIFNDGSDNIWIGTIKDGVYKYDGKEFKNYNVPISIMSITEDSKGNLWLGGAGGLYRINKNGEIVNVTTAGPWE